MNVLNNKCAEYFIQKRLLLDVKKFEREKKEELLNDHMRSNSKIGINLEKYHYIIVLGVFIYIIVAFVFIR